MRMTASLWAALVMLTCALTANAQAEPLRIWYRSGEGCPDGAEFLQRLAALGRTAQLATAGDHVDFVVTLGGPAPAAQALGRLERQTQTGTVAIRELRAWRCADVAEGLALSLELALQPAADAAVTPAPAAVAGEPALTDPELAANQLAPPAGAPDLSHSQRAQDAGPRAELSVVSFRPRWSLGAQATLLTGAAPDPLPGLAIFGSLAPAGARPSARLSLRGSYGESDSSTEAPGLQIGVVAARPEGCPWSWGDDVLIEPCAALDVGFLHAAGTGERGLDDTGLWLQGAAQLRVIWRLGTAVALEAELGAAVPFVRYALARHESGDLFRTEPIGLSLGVGASWLSP